METLVRIASIRWWEKDPLVFTYARQLTATKVAYFQQPQQFESAFFLFSYLVGGVRAQEIHVDGGSIRPLPVPCSRPVAENTPRSVKGGQARHR